ncbi:MULTISPECIES: transposase [Clostridium]|jgi:endonuclease V-like protein UPF0215 family|uniref:Transposase n=1 Tax=Clostridium lapidicellarium TaxID=3240931 RepID=A0ABV4E1R6_9CLOT|nr:transposase [Clostridium tyrobutyricum]
MINYNKLSYQIKRKILTFSNRICKNLSKPSYKFITQMIYGILENQTILLSDISRALKENISLKKTIERLSNNLKTFNKHNVAIDNYISEIKPYIDDNTVFCVDGSEITKRNSKVLEAMGKVRDGSTGETNINGYNCFEIAALTNKYNMPVSVYSKIYSNAETDFVSENEEVLEGLNFIRKHFGSKGIRALDRGFDDKKFYRYFINSGEPFVIRAKCNRNVIHNDKSINILKLANKYHGRFSTIVRNKAGKAKKCKFSFISIALPDIPDKPLTLVVIRGLGKVPMMLISSIKPDDKRLTLTIIQVYLKRWRIEEYFRFKKQQFDFENIRVRSLNSIRTMNLLLSLIVGFIAMLSEKRGENILNILIQKLSNRIYKIPDFDYYAVADGIYSILKKTLTGIKSFMKPVLKTKAPQQLFIAEALEL